MTRVSLSELKAKLSRYVREARRGGEVQILHRGVPVARLTGLGGSSAGQEQKRRQRLIDAGVLRPGSGGVSSVLDQPAVEIGTDLSSGLAEERSDRL